MVHFPLRTIKRRLKEFFSFKTAQIWGDKIGIRDRTLQNLIGKSQKISYTTLQHSLVFLSTLSNLKSRTNGQVSLLYLYFSYPPLVFRIYDNAIATFSLNNLRNIAKYKHFRNKCFGSDFFPNHIKFQGLRVKSETPNYTSFLTMQSLN